MFKAKLFNELTTAELYGILRSRYEVFTLEQKIYYQDMDGIDFDARHFFVEENGETIAYLRAFYVSEIQVKLGRVLTTKRGIGLGKEIMKKAIEDIQKTMKCSEIILDSQIHAIGFYEKLGFMTASDEFLEAGIPHVTMKLVIE